MPPPIGTLVSRPDIIVSWLQNDYGQLGRPAEAIAHALVDEGLARQVAYVEPAVPSETPPVLNARDERGLHVYELRGVVPDASEVAAAVVSSSGLENPVLLNFGVAEANWWFQHGYGPLCARTALVTHDVLHDWPGMPAERVERLARTRALLARSSDVVVGLSTGSIADLPGAVYVGHGCDDIWTHPGVDTVTEPADLAAIPHPRALYLGALSVRVEARGLRSLADAGVSVVLLGFSPSREIKDLIATHPNVHFLGARPPAESPPYLLHCDVGIVPHTDEPFTRSMEPHKLYNYACAGLPSVTLSCICPPSLKDVVTATEDVDAFTAATLAALERGRLSPAEVAAARSLTWGAVAQRIVAALG